MKTKLLATISIALFLSVASFAQNAQPAPGTGKKATAIGLNEEQKTKIKGIKMSAYKEMQPLKNQLGELKAKQKSLTTSDRIDMNAINQNIDEMEKIKSKIEKINVASRIQVRALLTDEQKMWFDSNKGKHKTMKHARKVGRYDGRFGRGPQTERR